MIHWSSFIKDVLWTMRIVVKKRFFVLVASLVISTGIALVSLFQAYANSVLVNTVVDSVGKVIDEYAVGVALVLVGTSLVVPAVLYVLQRYFEKVMYFYMSKRFDILIEEKRVELDIMQYEDSEFNNFVNRVNEKGVYIISNVITNLFYDYQSMVTIIFSSLVIVGQSPIIFLAILLSSIPELVIGAKYGRGGWYIWADEISAEDRRKYWNIKEHIKTLSSLTEIKLFGLGRTFVNRIKGFLNTVERAQSKNERKNMYMRLGAVIFSQGVLLIATVYFVHAAIVGEIRVGEIIFLFGGMVGFQNAVAALFTSIGRQQEDRLYMNDLVRFLKMTGEMKDGDRNLELTTSPEIRFEGIDFSYPGGKAKVYESLSLTISVGEKLAIVGLNGAGKTTLIKLLCRFYDPTKGAIFIDGVDLCSIKRSSWYEHMGVLFQDFAKFDFSKVGELVSFGDQGRVYDERRVDYSVSASDAGFVREWKGGYDQQLGNQFKDGVQPSGGQWQKLALARLFIEIRRFGFSMNLLLP